MFIKFRTPGWGLFWVALAAIFFIYTYQSQAQTAGTGSWRVVDFKYTASGVTVHVQAPPVCRSSFSTLAIALSCLSNKSWNFGYYTSQIAGTAELHAKYNNGLARESVAYCNSQTSVGVINSNYANSNSATSLYRVRCSFNILNISREYIGSGNSAYLNTEILNMNLNTGRSGSSCSPSNNSRCYTPRNVATNTTNAIDFLGIAFFPDEDVEERPDEPEDNECVDKSLTLALSAAEKNAKNPTAGEEFDFSGCTYRWEKPRSTPDTYTSACLSPIGGETLCFAIGVRLLSPPAPAAYEEITPENPLVVKIGDTAAEQKALKAPETAKELIGWGGNFGILIPLASQLPVVGNLVQAASQVSPELWSAWLNSFDEGLVKFELDYKKEQSPQDYYHPGNHTEGGAYLGAFDRDWGKTGYDADKAWNWNSTPATSVEDTGKLAVIEQPNGPSSGGGDTYITNITNHYNNSTIKYPPGVTPPGGNPTPPPDSSVPGEYPGHGDPEGDPDGDPEGEYEAGNRFYTPKYPNGLGGVWDGFKEEIMQTSGIGEFLNAFKMPTNVATSDLCFNFDFDMGKVIDLGEQGFCISENIILIVKALLIISAFVVARSLVFGG
ncbi:hypothetical protein [Brucella pituitosa]|uniref:Uncharacterized protein n=1 Tax=Brucella pituitosa TaxID=571256 RepID=A0ABS3JZV6_9HYPH|nr:hypothetical protein [Brucella pituitosa]MBO1040189.1 hypothetical protein [Brucella pituitosa]